MSSDYMSMSDEDCVILCNLWRGNTELGQRMNQLLALCLALLSLGRQKFQPSELADSRISSREQMYKKRFAKWGFRKNSRVSTKVVSASRTVSHCREARTVGPLCLAAVTYFDHQDQLLFTVLSNIRVCSVAFFESVQCHDESVLSSLRHSENDRIWSGKHEETNLSFKLAFDLLNRGYGDIAGRLIRKAFLMMENVLKIEGPALVWNVLEMMHHMVKLEHMKLFEMLLAYASQLVDGYLPKAHPIPAILQGIRRLVLAFDSNTTSTCLSSKSTSSSARSPSNLDDDTNKRNASNLLYKAVVSLLERAWTLNADILFDYFDPRLLPLYCRIDFDSCSIAPPARIVTTANKWFSMVELQHPFEKQVKDDPADNSALDAKETNTQQLCCLHGYIPDAQNYEILRDISVRALRNRWESALNQDVSFTGDTTILLPILAGLLSTRMLPQCADAKDFLGQTGCTAILMPMARLYAGHIACAIRTMVDLCLEGDWSKAEVSLEIVPSIRSIILLSEYAHTENDPRVLREMWLLQDALDAEGQYLEAREVEHSALNRLEKYVQDVPVACA